MPSIEGYTFGIDPEEIEPTESQRALAAEFLSALPSWVGLELHLSGGEDKVAVLYGLAERVLADKPEGTKHLSDLDVLDNYILALSEMRGGKVITCLQFASTEEADKIEKEFLGEE